MKTSELIEQLQGLQQEHGDLEVLDSFGDAVEFEFNTDTEDGDAFVLS